MRGQNDLVHADLLSFYLICLAYLRQILVDWRPIRLTRYRRHNRHVNNSISIGLSRTFGNILHLCHLSQETLLFFVKITKLLSFSLSQTKNRTQSPLQEGDQARMIQDSFTFQTCTGCQRSTGGQLPEVFHSGPKNKRSNIAADRPRAHSAPALAQQRHG